MKNSTNSTATDSRRSPKSTSIDSDAQALVLAELVAAKEEAKAYREALHEVHSEWDAESYEADQQSVLTSYERYQLRLKDLQLRAVTRLLEAVQTELSPALQRAATELLFDLPQPKDQVALTMDEAKQMSGYYGNDEDFEAATKGID